MKKKDKPIILVVDDSPDNIDVISAVLRYEYTIKVATNGERAIKIAYSYPQPDLILLDIMMPGTDGYEVCQVLKADPMTRKIPVIFVTAKIAMEDEIKGLELGAVDYITKPVSPPIVRTRVKTHLALYNQNRELDRKVRESTMELQETRLAVIQKLGRAAEYKDNETGMHVLRMSHYCRIIADALDYGDEWTDLVFSAAPMHDIGKIGISDRILLKPDKLDMVEWKEMQRHSEYGADIIGENKSEILKMAREIALSHHEKWDGSGYPNGLSEDQIPLPSRIVAIADVFDALTSVRPYKPAWSVEDSVALIKKNAGTHFDPSLVNVFISQLPEILKIKEKYSDLETP